MSMHTIRPIRAIARALLLASLCAAWLPLASQKKQMVVAIMEPSGDASRMNKSTVRGTLEQYVTKSKEYTVVDTNSHDKS